MTTVCYFFKGTAPENSIENGHFCAEVSRKSNQSRSKPSLIDHGIHLIKIKRANMAINLQVTRGSMTFALKLVLLG